MAGIEAKTTVLQFQVDVINGIWHKICSLRICNFYLSINGQEAIFTVYIINLSNTGIKMENCRHKKNDSQSEILNKYISV